MIPQPLYAGYLYEFLAELLPRIQRLGDAEVTQEFEEAILHYMPPVTSEFFGKAMVALQLAVDHHTPVFSPAELDKARNLVAAIKLQWFS